MLSEDLKRRVANLCLEDYYTYAGLKYPLWNHWGLYLDSAVTRTILVELQAALHELAVSFDVLCPVPTSGFPIAGMLYATCDAPVMASFHWKDARMHAEDELLRMFPGTTPVRVGAVDSVVHTGTSLFLTQAMVQRRLKGEIVFLLAISNNDLVAPDLVDPVKLEFIKNNRLMYLLRVSELEMFWDRRNEAFMAERARGG